MDLGLENKVALVAGGSSGMGLAAARELAREGAHVAIGARGQDQLKLAVAQLEEVAGSNRISATSLDLTDIEASRQWVRQVADEFGALHIVLVSGGSPPMGTAGKFQLADYQAALAKVLYPAIALALAALPHLQSAGWGRLLFIGSETAVAPVRPLPLSGVARAGLVRFVQGLAADVGQQGITVNMIAPGTIHTPPLDRAAARLAGPGASEAEVAERLAAMGHHSALGRLGRPEEIGAAVAFLASERASFITGGVHLVDGGASLIGPDAPHLSPENFS
ncbi:MAG TPA: SDR family oxidoreductase [Jatrophihabitans sp.]|nr:SDR family oxidoreductase [Jatrophihabitans sp.]